MRLAPWVQKKGEGPKMRVPKAKGMRRRYFKPSPSLPSLTSPLCLHTHADASLCVYMDIAHSHQFLSASLTDTLILVPSKTHPVKPRGGVNPPKTFSSAPTHFSVAPTTP